MKINKIWKLYQELRRLRNKVKALEADLSRINTNYNILLSYKKSQEVLFNTMTITMPNVHRIEIDYHLRDESRRPIADHIYKRMSEQMKIKLVDDLFEQGYIRKIQDDDVCESYEIKVVR
jgi:hypothetical protein